MLPKASPFWWAAESALTIKDNLGRAWDNEPIGWVVPGASGDTVRVERNGKPIPAQLAPEAGCARADQVHQNQIATRHDQENAQAQTGTELEEVAKGAPTNPPTQMRPAKGKFEPSDSVIDSGLLLTA